MLNKIYILLGMLFSLCGIYSFCYKYHLETIDKLSPQITLLLLLVLMLSLIISIVLSYPFKKTPKLKLKYAIYWDKDKNPYCPICKSPISGYDNYPYVGRSFHCNKCDKKIPLNNNGKVIEIEQVLEEI